MRSKIYKKNIINLILKVSHTLFSDVYFDESIYALQNRLAMPFTHLFQTPSMPPSKQFIYVGAHILHDALSGLSFAGSNSTMRVSVQYTPRNMHTVFALLCFVVVIHWLIFPYPSDLLHWHCGNLTIAPVPVKQPWWIWINTSCEFIMNDCVTTTKQSTTKPCAYFFGHTVCTVYLKRIECYFVAYMLRTPIYH